MNETISTIALSATAAAGSVAASATGDNVMQWVMLGVNILVLLSNTALSIYRKWRDRDADKKKQEQEAAQRAEGSDDGEVH